VASGGSGNSVGGGKGANIGTGGGFMIDISAPGSDISSSVNCFPVTASVSGSGGSISPAGSWSVNNGASMPFTITPDAGFAIASVLVDGTNNPAAVQTGSYMLSNTGTAGHSIVAAFSTAIASVDLTVTAPATGNTPSTSYTTTTSGLTTDVPTWSPPATVFAPGTSYTFSATLTADSDYAFATAPDLSATVNGQAASIVNNGDGTATVTYIFARTKVTPALSAVTASPVSPLTLPGTVTLQTTLSGAYPGNASQPVTFTVNGTDSCTGVQTNASGIAQCVLTNPPATGSPYTFGASFAADAANDAATAADLSGYLVNLVPPAPLSVTGLPAVVTVGMPDFTLTATGGGAGAVTWSSSDPTVVTVSAGGVVHVLSASAAPVTITADKASDGIYAATSGDVSFTVGEALLPTATTAVPALNEWALALLALLLASGAAVRVRRGR